MALHHCFLMEHVFTICPHFLTACSDDYYGEAGTCDVQFGLGMKKGLFHNLKPAFGNKLKSCRHLS